MSATTPIATGPDGAGRAIRDTDPEAQAEQLRQQVATALEFAERAGATAAEANASDATGLAVTVRQRELETVEFNNDRGLAVTVYVGHRKGHATTSDTSASAIRDTVRAAVNIAKYTEEDPCNGLAPAELMATTLPDLDLHHPWPIDVAEATRLATAAEAAALDADQRIVNSEGAEVETRRSCYAFGNSSASSARPGAPATASPVRSSPPTRTACRASSSTPWAASPRTWRPPRWSAEKPHGAHWRVLAVGQ